MDLQILSGIICKSHVLGGAAPFVFAEVLWITWEYSGPPAEQPSRACLLPDSIPKRWENDAERNFLGGNEFLPE